MTQVVSIHSYRRGTGKTVLTVNLAVLIALVGKKVAIIDAAFQGPGTQFFFDLNKKANCFFNDYLGGHCEIEDAAYDVTSFLKSDLAGQLFVVPANVDFRASLAAESGYQFERFEAGIDKLIKDLALDIVLIDTSAGMKDDALMPMVISDTVIEVLRLDQQDYQGTAVITEITRKLEIPRVLLVANIVSRSHQHELVKREIEGYFDLDVASILPVSEDILVLPEGTIFALKFPTHPITQTLRNLAVQII